MHLEFAELIRSTDAALARLKAEYTRLRAEHETLEELENEHHETAAERVESCEVRHGALVGQAAGHSRG